MELKNLISSNLKIPLHYIRCLSDKRVVCMVTKEWLRNAYNETIVPVDEYLDPAHSEEYLAASCNSLPQSWLRISAKAVRKSDSILECLSSGPLYSDFLSSSLTELLSYVCKENRKNLWQNACSKYQVHQTNSAQPKGQRFSDAFRESLLKFHPKHIVNLKKDEGDNHHDDSSVTLHGIVPILVYLDCSDHIIVLQPYYSCCLWNIVAYSPALFNQSHAKTLFVLYQILQAMQHCHSRGVSAGNMSLHNILVDTKLSVDISFPQTAFFKKLCQMWLTQDDTDVLIFGSSVKSTQVIEARAFVENYQHAKFTIADLPAVVDDWVYRRLTNFKYLMILNHLAGRRLGDPNNHPILPWVMNFQSPDRQIRDLSKTKYRLNKGDRQLDLTYEEIPVLSGDPAHRTTYIPHHVSDVLSDITYYVYKARITPIPILCAHVRPYWVPSEYPGSIQRIQQWTPDECIPEFFMDPNIFVSIHDDLPDLEIPVWCSSVEDFIEKHMAVLEGEAVSESLHHWIDLTFGYKLSGVASVKAKNVHLQLVDQHTHVTNCGVVQLFTHPHPPRIMASNTLRGLSAASSVQVALEATEDLNSSMDASSSVSDDLMVENTSVWPVGLSQCAGGENPLATLEHLESLYTFNDKTMHRLPKSVAAQPTGLSTMTSENIVAQDMQAFGCLMCEMFLASHMRMLSSEASLTERYHMIYRLCKMDINILPRPLRQAASILLQLDGPFALLKDDGGPAFKYKPINNIGLPPPTPALLTHPLIDIFPFPFYFPELYTCLCSVKQKELEIQQLQFSGKSSGDKAKLSKILAREKVSILEKFLSQFHAYLGHEGLHLLLPYIEELLQDSQTAVQAAWCLFNIVACELGPDESKKRFLPCLMKLYTEENLTPKHLKLYHHKFLTQLLVRLGLRTFLENFSTLLVEAVAGYKDFVIEMDAEQQELPEVEEEFRQKKSSFSVLESIPVCPEDEDGYSNDMLNTGTAEVAAGPDLNDYDTFPENILLEDRMHRDSEDRLDFSSLDQESIKSEEGGRLKLSGMDEDRDSLYVGGGRMEISDTLQLDTDQIHNQSASNNDLDVVPDKMNPAITKEPLSEVCNDTVKDGLISRDDSEIALCGDESVEAEQAEHMVRSETDEFTHSLAGTSKEEMINISDVAAESIKWLCHRLGPLLAAKFISLNLIRLLPLCYFDEDQLQCINDNETNCRKSCRLVVGDKFAVKVLECLAFFPVLYGEQVILLQYLPAMADMVAAAEKELTPTTEAGLIASLVLLRHMIPLLSEKALMDLLQDFKVHNILHSVIKLTSTLTCFPCGHLSRSSICYKIVDVIYIIGLRIGLEMTRKHMTSTMQLFFEFFYQVYGQVGPDEVRSSPPKQGTDTGYQSAQMAQRAASNLVEEDDNAEDLYWKIKLDLTTQEYKIGSPVSVHELSPPPPQGFQIWKSRTKKLSTRETKEAKHEDQPPVDNGNDLDKMMGELKKVFTPELAHTAYIPLCQIFGSIHMEQSLWNDDLIRQLCIQHDCTLDKLPTSSSSSSLPYSPDATDSGMTDLETPDELKQDLFLDGKDSSAVLGALGSNVEVVGNQIRLQKEVGPVLPEVVHMSPTYRQTGILKISSEDLRCGEMETNSRRHLRGNLLAYWEHELGLSDRMAMFNFKHIKLQTFLGHTTSIRSMCALDSENSFISGSKDKTVKLWSLTSFGDGNGKCGCQWTYRQHKKSVFSIGVLDCVRLVASCDSTVHIWDPFTGECIQQLESAKNSPVIALTPIPAPSTCMVTATTDSTLRFLDLRKADYAHEYRCSGPAGLIRCMTVSPDSNWVAVAFSSGIISLLDLRTGRLLGQRKGHDGEILQIKACNRHTLVTSSFDQSMKLWSTGDIREICQFKGPTEPVHCISLYRNQIISATAGNKIGVHSSIDRHASYTSTKLLSDAFKGVLTSMSVLPLNRTLLLGADNGAICLLC